MKHVMVLSNTKPACAEQTAWVEVKNIFGGLALTPQRSQWLGSQIDDYLQK